MRTPGEGVGLAAHGRDHHHKLGARGPLPAEPCHMAQPLRVFERAAAVFLHNQHVHASKSIKSKGGGQTRRRSILFGKTQDAFHNLKIKKLPRGDEPPDVLRPCQLKVTGLSGLEHDVALFEIQDKAPHIAVIVRA